MMEKNRLLIVWLLALLPASLQAQIEVDGRFGDWQRLPELAFFSADFSPVFFNLEKAGSTESARVSDSLYWGRGGTNVREIKGFTDRESIYLYLESHTPFSEELSFYIYLYPDREKAMENRFTIEIVTTRGSRESMVLMWEKDRVLPKLIGQVAHSSIMLECRIPIADLPDELSSYDISKASFDVTSCYHARTSGLFEEFFFATVRYWDVVLPEDIGL